MNWSEIAKDVGAIAPWLGGLLGGPGGAAVGALAARVLCCDATPEAVSVAVAADPQAALKLATLQDDEHVRLAALTEQHFAAELQAESSELASINTTMQAEAKAEDAFTRRWRPTWGYVTAACWLAQTLAIVWAIVFQPTQAAPIITAVAALSPMWGIALAVLGVAVVKRSHDKQVAAGQTPPSLSNLVKRNV